MIIIKRESLEFNEKEGYAMQLIIEICTGLMREATDPSLVKLAEATYNNLSELWGWEE